MTNPFLGYGRPVSGQRLIGRKRELAKLSEHISHSEASISVVGQRRIGKTSLATELKRLFGENGIPGLVLIFVDLSTFTSIMDFFNFIMEELEDHYLETEKDVPPKFQRVLSKDVKTPYQAYRRCRRGLVLIKQLGINTKLIVDEFDAIRKFENADQLIQWLRELVDKGFETGLSAIFLSRRSLFSIENQIVHVSNLDHLCEKLYLKPLNFDQLCFLVDRGIDKISTSQAEKLLLHEYTGGHPYLSEMILCHSCDRGSIDAGIRHSISEIYSFYEQLRSLLEQDGLFDQLLQLTVGPIWKIRMNSAPILSNYGVLVGNSDESTETQYFGWSEHFQAYLEKVSRDSPVWEQWAQTETLMRDLVEDNLSAAYGSDWETKLKSRKNTIPVIIRNCEEKMVSEQKKFGPNIKCRWIEYTYPNDLWQIISLEWQNFSDVFQHENKNKNKKYWTERFQLLSKIRNPLAHNRRQVIPKHEITLANVYCTELCELIRNFTV